jgi:dipeptidyl aminopeptidase/acylaminoacyl peptidase
MNITKFSILFLLLFAQFKVHSETRQKFDGPLKFEEIFRNANYSGLRLSPNGKYMSAHSLTESGQYVMHIFNRKTFEEVNRVQFDDPKISVGSTSWISDKRVMFSLNSKSNEFEDGYSVASMVMNIDGTEKRYLWNNQTNDNAAFGGEVMGKADKDHFYLNAYPSGAGGLMPYNYLYKLNINTGSTSRIMRSPVRLGRFIMKKNEVTHVVGTEPDSYDATVVYRKNDKDEWVLESKFHHKEGGATPVGWSPDGDKILYEDNIDAPTVGLYWVDPKTGEKELIYRHPKVDVSAYDLRRDAAGRIWGVNIEYDYPKTIILDESNPEAQLYQQLVKTFKGARLQIMRNSPTSPEYIVHVSSDQQLGEYYLFNELDGQLKYFAAQYKDHDPNKVGKMFPVRYNARDGLEINGYLSVPPGINDPKNLPMILLPHGGPYGIRDHWGSNREVRAFTNAGYAVLQVNFRGSGGYGRDFYFNAYQQWGLEMQDDLTDATLWAIQNGIADKERICIYGASYGGFAAMSGMWKTPDLFKCGIGYVGVYDMNVFSTHSDTELGAAGRRYFVEALGSTEEQRYEQSPIAHVNEMKNPIMLITGARDVRVHIKHFYILRDALLDINYPLETLVVPRAGHGARDITSQTEIYCRMIDFFDRHIGYKNPKDKPDSSCHSEDAIVPLEFNYYREN